LAVVLSCLPLLRDIRRINLDWDWHQTLSFYRAASESVLAYFQMPLRTPYFDGGYPLLAHPLDGSLNPFFLPPLLLGEVIGIKLNIILFHIIGAWGMYYLAKKVLQQNTIGAIFATAVFCLGGNTHRLLVTGQTYPAGYYFFMPLLLAFFIKSFSDGRFIIWASLVLALLVTQASLRFAVATLFLAAFAVLNTAGLKDGKFFLDVTPLKNLLIVIGLTLLLGAVKILPMAELLAQAPRTTSGYNPFWGLSWATAADAFFSNRKIFEFPGQLWNHHYVGYLPVIFAFFAGVFLCKKTWRFIVLGIIFGFLGLGAKTHFDLFGLLRNLPVFNSIETPARYFMPLVIFALAVTGGYFFSVAERLAHRTVKAILILAVFVVALDLFLAGAPQSRPFTHEVPAYQRQKRFFTVKNIEPGKEVSNVVPPEVYRIRSWEWTRPTQYELMLQNIGKANAYTNLHLKDSVVPRYYVSWDGSASIDPANYVFLPNQAYRGEAYFMRGEKNTVEFVSFTPNKLVVRCEVKTSDILVVNQNYHRWWRSDIGRPFSHNGLLALGVDRAGSHTISFRYVPVTFYAGLAVSLCALCCLLYWLKKLSAKKRG